jgi:hypothetical protein
MTEQQNALFSVGLTYWPRRTAFGWWQAFDRGEVREELEHIAALGCDTVRLCLRWEDFQPGARRINSGALNALEYALDLAQQAGLRVVAALFPVALGGALQLPRWANGADPLDELRRAARLVGPALVLAAPDGPLLLYDDGYHRNQAGDLFTDTKALDAQRYLIGELAGYFGPHPALYAWQLGEGLERVNKPAPTGAVYDWYAATVETLRAHHAGARVLGMVSTLGLTSGVGPRPDQIAATCDLLGVAVSSPRPPVGAHPEQAAYEAFLQALTASLGRRPALVSGLGLPTAPDERPGWISDSSYGQAVRVYRGDAEQQAAFVADALDRLQRAGAPGVWLAAYADYPQPLWRMPPLDRAIRERTLGLVEGDGHEKPAAAALRRFAAERRPVADIAPTIDVDPERYWRDPKQEFVELWREWSAEE